MKKMLMPNREWLIANRYGGLVKAMAEKPELFAHIPQEQSPPSQKKSRRKASV